MGCLRGEIEIGISNSTQINLEMQMRNLFPEFFSQQSQFTEISHPFDQNRPSSSSSSLRSLSLEPCIEQAIKPTTITFLQQQQQQQQALEAYKLLRRIQFPSAESDEAAMTRAMLAVISSTSSSSSSYPPQTRSFDYQVLTHEKGAFNAYTPKSLIPGLTGQMQPNLRRQSMLKRSIALFRNLNSRRIEERLRATRSTSTQLHHKMSERKRREKLNESIQSLRSLLPQGTKKDKVSVLSTTRDYLSALQAQVDELKQKNKILEERLFPVKEVSEEINGSSSERFNIQITGASSQSTSEEREIELQVNVRGDCDLMNLIIRILEFLKRINNNNVGMVSIEAETQLQQTGSFNRVIIRLKIKGHEWDESAFREAIARVVADVT